MENILQAKLKLATSKCVKQFWHEACANAAATRLWDNIAILECSFGAMLTTNSLRGFLPANRSSPGLSFLQNAVAVYLVSFAFEWEVLLDEEYEWHL